MCLRTQGDGGNCEAVTYQDAASNVTSEEDYMDIEASIYEDSRLCVLPKNYDNKKENDGEMGGGGCSGVETFEKVCQQRIVYLTCFSVLVCIVLGMLMKNCISDLFQCLGMYCFGDVGTGRAVHWIEA